MEFGAVVSSSSEAGLCSKFWTGDARVAGNAPGILSSINGEATNEDLDPLESLSSSASASLSAA